MIRVSAFPATVRSALVPALAALLLAGCASWAPQPKIIPGDSADSVRARLGNPTSVYPLPGGQELEYATGPFGQKTWMVRLDANGKVTSAEQVLTAQTFAKIRTGEFRKDDVLRLIGRPAERSRVYLHNYEVWSYRYKENDVWNSMMHVHFDEDGVVRMLMSGPDPMFSDERRPFR
jgi:hypothetical protein